MDGHLPLILIEVVLVFGGALAFGWWQFREIKRDRAKAAARRAQNAAAGSPTPTDDPDPKA